MMSTSFFLGRQKLIASKEHAGHGAVARAAVRLDDEELRKRDGVLQAADQPRRRARQPAANLEHLADFELDGPADRVAVGGLVLEGGVAGAVANALAVVGGVQDVKRQAQPASSVVAAEQPRAVDEAAKVDGQQRRKMQGVGEAADAAFEGTRAAPGDAEPRSEAARG